MLLVVTAVPQEADRLIRRLGSHDESRVGDAVLHRGRFASDDVSVVTTGAGRENAEAGFAAACDAVRPDVVLSAGFSGGLDPSLSAGSVVVGRRVRRSEPEKWRHGEAEEVWCDNRLVVASRRALKSAGIDYILADCGSVDAYVANREAKTETWNSLGAAAVDLESYWIACLAIERSLPFAALRVVLDPSSLGLPAFARDWKGGAADIARVAKSPGDWPATAGLLRAYRTASRQLERALVACLPAVSGAVATISS